MSFRMQVLGYSYPKSPTPEDKDWLNIEINANDKYNSWKASGSYIRTRELVKLEKWIRKVYVSEFIEDQIDFLEPELSFCVSKNAAFVFQVELKYGLMPTLPVSNSQDISKKKMSFLINSQTINNLHSYLQDSVVRFPIIETGLLF